MTILLERPMHDDDQYDRVEYDMPDQEVVVPHTTVQEIVDQDAELHPDVWSASAQPLFGREGGIALTATRIGVHIPTVNHAYVPGPDNEYHATPLASSAWLVNAYGSRWAKNDQGESVLETTSLEHLSELHQDIIDTVLVDEHSRPAKLVTEASHVGVGTYTPNDINIWLTTIHEGYSPVLATGEVDENGNQVFLTHDFTDYHTGSNLFWGRKMQDKVTKAAGYELQRLADSKEMPRGVEDGISAIDTLTCSEQQLDLINYAMHGPAGSPKANILAAWREFTTTDDHYAPKYWENGPGRLERTDVNTMVGVISALSHQTEKMENYLQWYESGGERTATEEELQAALMDALQDITRVAEKLQGSHDGTDLAIEAMDPRNGAAEALGRAYGKDSEVVLRQRSEWLEGLLDKDHTLPAANLHEDREVLDLTQRDDPAMVGFRLTDSAGKPAGSVRLKVEESPDGIDHVAHMTWVQTERQGQGYGKAMYLELLKALPEGVTLESDKTLTPDSLRMWQWLEENNLAIRQYEGELTETTVRDTTYLGYDGKTALYRSLVPAFSDRMVLRALKRQTADPYDH